MNNLIIGLLEHHSSHFSTFKTRESIADAISVFASAFENKILSPSDMECIMTFLLSFPKPNSGTLPLLASMTHHTVEMALTSAILQLSFSCTDKLPGIIDDVLKCTVWAVQFDSSQQLKDFLLILLLQMVPSVGKTPFPTESVFDLWVSLSKHLNTELSVKLCIRLEYYLAHLFESPGAEQEQWTLYQRIINMSAELFTETCLTTITHRAAIIESDDTIKASCLLSAVLSYDCSKFQCIAQIMSGIESDVKLVRLWNGGFLDRIVLTFVLQMEAINGTGVALDPVYGKALAVIGKRMICLLDREVSLVDNLFLCRDGEF